MAKSKGYVSKGTVGKNKSILKAVKRDRTEGDKLLNLMSAWKNDQNPWLVVPGTTKKESLKRVRANDYWGSPKGAYHMGKNDGTTETV